MTTKILLILCFLLFNSRMLFSQTNLYMPRNLKTAYEKGTRSMDGKPGKNYWQNNARYDISISVAPPDRHVKGNEQIVYFNNSPDTLRNPVIKLFLNIHQPGAAREFLVGEEYLSSGIGIDAASVNGKTIPWAQTSISTQQTFRLPQPLLPHDSVRISFDWHFELSQISNREGMLDPTSFFIAYFYPRVAVFDDYYGWDRMIFTDGHEFYSDFNDYTLTVNVPKNFIVWSTGTLNNTDDVLQPVFAQKLKNSFTSDELISIAAPADLNAKNITAQKEINSWKWSAKHVPDISLCISDHYVWDGASVIVDKKTGRRASVQAAYIDTAKDFHQMVSFGRHALDWFSNNWPGVPYPYEKTTIIQGLADMEYPMMVNDNTNEYPEFSRFVVEHEIAHTWFPFYMGINETRYGFMDEGWATALELFIAIADIGEEKAIENFQQFRVTGWINDPSGEEDLPIIIPGNALSGVALGNNEYGKAALAYHALKDMLGEMEFKKCLHEYMNRWNGKHPTPWDFFYTFNNVSGKNLNWFWNSWFFSNGYIDLAIKNVKKGNGSTVITIENKGGFAAPVNLLIKYSDGSNETKHINANAWMTKKETVIETKNTKKVTSLKLDGGIFMDADEKNNNWEMK